MERTLLRAGLLPSLALLCLLPAMLATAEEVPRPARSREPHAGYVFPAGGQAGTTLQIKVGGQFLRRVRAVHLSGGGVEAKIVYWIPPQTNLDAAQSRELRRLLKTLRSKKRVVTGGKSPAASKRRAPGKQGKGAKKGKDGKRAKKGKDGKGAKKGKDVEPGKLPTHPLLEDLESKSPDELDEVERYFFRRRIPLQRKRAIEETLKVNLTISSDATPGIRDLRLETPTGLSNPLRFRVGLLPEALEHEPNHPTVSVDRALTPPVVLNGTILPRDIDRYRIRARAGQRLVFRAEARGLIPYQADSVPGWMQATLALYDHAGKQVAFADEYRFDPDPVLFFEVPRDGEYLLEVSDAIARGRDDFVYRVTVGELPFITHMFPLGGREGTLAKVAVSGWNINWKSVPLDTRAGRGAVREKAWRQGDALTNGITYAVDSLPEMVEVEPNETLEAAQVVTTPHIVNGRIGQPGDVDWFRFKARGGDEIVAEVSARSLASPLDSLLRLYDAKGAVIAWNDDHVHKGLGVRGLGLVTHHADSYLRTRLPRKGTYFLQVADARRHGSDAHAYRLRIGPPRPDVALFVTPSSISLRSGRAAVVTVHAVRMDGYEGDIDVRLQDGPDGLVLGGGRIPAGQDRERMTLSAPRIPTVRPFALRLVGSLRVGSELVERPVVPADDVMQAFLWRHLVPAQEIAVSVFGSGRWAAIAKLDEPRPVRIPRGGKVTVHFTVDGRFSTKNLRLALVNPPKGVSVGGLVARHGSFTLDLMASREAQRSTCADNLIVEVISVYRVPPKGDAKGKKGKRRRKGDKPGTLRGSSLGVLPAIPALVVRQ